MSVSVKMKVVNDITNFFSAVSCVSFILISLFLFAGPVASLCNERFGTRVTMFTGGILSALGLLISAFITKFYMVLVSFGLLSGRPKSLEN